MQEYVDRPLLIDGRYHCYCANFLVSQCYFHRLSDTGRNSYIVKILLLYRLKLTAQIVARAVKTPVA